MRIPVNGYLLIKNSKHSPLMMTNRWLITKKRKLADKPGSVEGNHSSGVHVTMHLKQPTREQRGPRIMFPYLVLLRVGFTMPQTVTCCAVRSYRTISPLPDCIGPELKI